MKLNNLVCLNNSYLSKLVKVVERDPVLAVSVVNNFNDFKGNLKNYGLNYFLFFLTGNPKLKKEEEQIIDFIFKKVKKHKNMIPVIILPLWTEEGVNQDNANVLAHQIIEKVPAAFILNMNNGSQKTEEKIENIHRSYNRKLLAFFRNEILIPDKIKHTSHREIVINIEMTGLSPEQGHKIIEIGCVELMNHKPTGIMYHQYINPQRSIAPEFIDIHGLTESFLADKPTFNQIIDNFLNFIGNDSALVMHNAPFDMRFLNTELETCKKPVIKNQIIDTLSIARQQFPQMKNNLNALCERFHLDIISCGLQGTLLDSILLAEIYAKLLELKAENR